MNNDSVRKIRKFNEYQFKDTKGYDLMKIDKRFLVRDYMRIKEDNKELHNKVDILINNLENSINSINDKLSDKEIRVENGIIVNPINDYRIVRLKAIRMKCKELLKILKDSDVDEKRY